MLFRVIVRNSGFPPFIRKAMPKQFDSLVVPENDVRQIPAAIDMRSAAILEEPRNGLGCRRWDHGGSGIDPSGISTNNFAKSP